MHGPQQRKRRFLAWSLLLGALFIAAVRSWMTHFAELRDSSWNTLAALLDVALLISAYLIAATEARTPAMRPRGARPRKRA